LLTLQRFNNNGWWPFTAFPFNFLDGVSNRESGTRIAAASHRGELIDRVITVSDTTMYI